MSTDNGGPAFPVPNTEWQSPGMMLRDYFAAKELARMDYHQCMVCDVPSAYERLAIHCYRMADAMLKAREQS
jgi:hypothetical protein